MSNWSNNFNKSYSEYLNAQILNEFLIVIPAIPVILKAFNKNFAYFK